MNSLLDFLSQLSLLGIMVLVFLVLIIFGLLCMAVKKLFPVRYTAKPFGRDTWAVYCNRDGKVVKFFYPPEHDDPASAAMRWAKDRNRV